MSTFDVGARTIYSVRHGSHAYGTSTPTSDVDVKGICVPPRVYYLGYSYIFEQEERLASKGHPEDKVTYSIEKFFRLAADCNPNIIEVLHVDDSDVLKIDRWGERLRGSRDLFVSKKARFTFSGYAHAQLKRIQTHRRWLMEKDKYEREKPSREEFGLSPLKEGQKNELEMAFAEVQKRLDEWNVDMMGLDEAAKVHLQQKLAELFVALKFDREKLWEAAAVSVFGNDQNLIHTLQRERNFANVVSDWEKYQNWKRSRNPARAALEAKFGYDTKHGGHLVRLMRMCKEILDGKGVIVKRPDAPEILEIRGGKWPYEKLMEEADRMEKECEASYRTSTLRHKPDVAALNDLCSETIESYHHHNG